MGPPGHLWPPFQNVPVCAFDAGTLLGGISAGLKAQGAPHVCMVVFWVCEQGALPALTGSPNSLQHPGDTLPTLLDGWGRVSANGGAVGSVWWVCATAEHTQNIAF